MQVGHLDDLSARPACERKTFEGPDAKMVERCDSNEFWGSRFSLFEEWGFNFSRSVVPRFLL